MKLHHLGVATTNIEKSIGELQKVFGIKHAGKIVFDPLQKAHLCMVKTDADMCIELVCGESVKNIALSGRPLYHSCYETDKFDQEVERLLAEEMDMISTSKQAVLFEDRRIAFFRTDGGLVELLENKNEEL